MISRYSVLVSLGILAVSHGYGIAHLGSRVVPVLEIQESELPDLHDGTLEDWGDILPSATLVSPDFTSIGAWGLSLGADGPPDPSTLALQVYLAWNSARQRLYFAIERADDIYINTYAGGDLGDLWRHDGVSIAIDGDHSGGPYNGFARDSLTDAEIRALTNSQAQMYQAIAESPDGRILSLYGADRDWATLPPWADAGGLAVGEGPNYTAIEMELTAWDHLDWKGPEFSQQGELSAGKIIGLEISVPDWDQAPPSAEEEGLAAVQGAYDGYYNLTGRLTTWRDASTFVDGILLSCAGECESVTDLSAVEQDSWGRIKASCR